MAYFTLKDQGDKPQTYIKETSETNKLGETLRKEAIVFPPVGHSNQRPWHSLSFSLRGEPFCFKASKKKDTDQLKRWCITSENFCIGVQII